MIGRLHARWQPERLDHDLAFDVRTGHIYVLAHVQPDRLHLLVRHLDHVLEAQRVATVLQRKGSNHITQLHIAYVRVLGW